MQIATWNVNSIAARLPLVVRWLEGARPDVLCLQETKCPDERFPYHAFAEIGYTAAHWGAPTYNGVAILAREQPADVLRGFGEPGDELIVDPNPFVTQPRLLTATIGGVRVVCAYVPNGQSIGTDKYENKLRWLDRLYEFFESSFGRDEPLALCGDFNVAPDDRDVYDPAKWRGRILCSDPERARMDALIEWGLIDAFRLHTSEAGHFSWWDYRGGDFRRNEGLRIDHVWVTEPLAARSSKTWIDAAPRGWERPSDHTPVVAEFTD